LGGRVTTGLVTALIGARVGFEASSYFVDEGDKPRIGRALLAIDPGRRRAARPTMPGWKSGFRPCCRSKICAFQDYRRHDIAHKAEQGGLEVSEVAMQK
jgi:(2R)-3-sulfolactate dehydrogenase (NADP+)